MCETKYTEKYSDRDATGVCVRRSDFEQKGHLLSLDDLWEAAGVAHMRMSHDCVRAALSLKAATLEFLHVLPSTVFFPLTLLHERTHIRTQWPRISSIKARNETEEERDKHDLLSHQVQLNFGKRVSIHVYRHTCMCIYTSSAHSHTLCVAH